MCDVIDTSKQSLYILQPEVDINFIETKYPESTILGYFETLYRNYLIYHDGVIKRLQVINLDDSFKWMVTTYPLAKGEMLPSDMVDYIQRKYEGYSIERVLWQEHRSGKDYFVRLTKGADVIYVNLTPGEVY